MIRPLTVNNPLQLLLWTLAAARRSYYQLFALSAILMKCRPGITGMKDAQEQEVNRLMRPSFVGRCALDMLCEGVRAIL
jgi:hypothetical protein